MSQGECAQGGVQGEGEAGRRGCGWSGVKWGLDYRLHANSHNWHNPEIVPNTYLWI